MKELCEEVKEEVRTEFGQQAALSLLAENVIPFEGIIEISGLSTDEAESLKKSLTA